MGGERTVFWTCREREIFSARRMEREVTKGVIVLFGCDGAWMRALGGQFGLFSEVSLW